MATGTTAPAAASQRSVEREWRASDGTCRIAFSNRTLEELRFESSRAMNGPGGQGVGGVLLGTRLGEFFRIVRYQPIPCAYSLGPDFRLSAGEESGLSKLLEGLRSGPESQDLQPVGWFVSHPRGGLEMSGADRQLHEKFFAAFGVALVARPDRLGEMDLAVYFEGEGSAARVGRVEPVLSIVPDISFRPERRRLADRRVASAQTTSRIIAEPAAATSSRPERRRLADRRVASVLTTPQSIVEPAVVTAKPRRAGQLVPLLLVLLLGAVSGALYWRWPGSGVAATSTAAAENPIEMLSLHVAENSGRFYISWNGKSEAIQESGRVLLVIQDGAQVTRRELSNSEAATGVDIYRRVSGDVKVTLEVHRDKGGVLEETTHYTASGFTAPAVLRITPEAPAVEVFDPVGIPLGPEK